MNGAARRIRPVGEVEMVSWADHVDRPQPSAADRTLAAQAAKRWGFCGVAAGPGNRPTGALLLGAGSPIDASTRRVEPALVLGLYVSASERGQGLGRHLVQSAAAELLKRDVVALDAVGHPELPAAFLLAVGFRLIQPDPIAPRYRMDLSATVRWRPDLGAAWQRITGLVPATIPPPQPAGFEPACRNEHAPAAS